jgi:hypothetical protein
MMSGLRAAVLFAEVSCQRLHKPLIAQLSIANRSSRLGSYTNT